MPYRSKPAARPHGRVTSPALTALILAATGCADDDRAPVELATVSLDGCLRTGGGPPIGDPIGMNGLLETMADDLRTVALPDRADVRYITLAHLRDAGAGSACLATHRAAMNHALNSVSTGLRATPAVQVDDAGTVFRIELEDHGWDAADWQRLVAGYPYNVRYDGDSPLLPFRDDLADELRDETGAAVPFVHGDWLATAAMRPPLYYGMLGLPDTLAGLEEQLGIDTVAATHDEEVARAGFVRSGASGASRMIARFELPGGAGPLWTSCDVDARGRGETILTDPIDPICDRYQVVFALPNGMPAYYLADEDGRRQATAPAAGGPVVAGISCAGCHGATGVIARADEVRDHVRNTGSAAELDRILALYPSRDEMAARVADDQDRFVAARRAAGAPGAAVEPLSWVATEHDRPLDARMAAATLGLEAATFRDWLEIEAGQLPAAAEVLRRDDGVIDRRTWDQVFGELVCALALGAPCDTRDGGDCSCR
jgi:hypothetical protein